MKSVFPLRDPAFTTFFGVEHFGQFGFVSSKSEKSVGKVFLDLDLVVVVDFLLGMLIFMV
jgi:hypothetical protein